MRLGDDVLLEIVDIVRRGIAEGVDVSRLLRDLDLDVESMPGGEPSGLVVLSRRYRADHGMSSR